MRVRYTSKDVPCINVPIAALRAVPGAPGSPPDSKSKPLLEVLSIEELEKSLGLSKSTIYRRIKDSGFPAPIRLSLRRVGWEIDTVQEWLKRCREAGWLVNRE